MKKIAIPKEITIPQEIVTSDEIAARGKIAFPKKIAFTKKITFSKKIAIPAIIVIVAAAALIVLAFTSDRLPKKERNFLKLVQIPAENLNVDAGLTLLESGNSLTFGDSVLLSLENQSHDTLTFPADYGVRILINDKGSNDWVELTNLTDYPHVGDRQLLPIGKDSTGEVMFSVFPDTQGLSQPVLIRVVVSGRTTPNGDVESEAVGAYIEFTLSP
jgi:hypothetical protein